MPTKEVGYVILYIIGVTTPTGCCLSLLPADQQRSADHEHVKTQDNLQDGPENQTSVHL